MTVALGQETARGTEPGLQAFSGAFFCFDRRIRSRRSMEGLQDSRALAFEAKEAQGGDHQAGSVVGHGKSS